MATIAQNLETLDTAISTMKTNLNLDADASLSDVVSATSGGGGGGVDLSEYFNLEVWGGQNQTNNYTNYCIKKLPDNLTIYPGITSLRYAFENMHNLVTAPALNTSTIINMSYMFSGCNKLENLPVYDTSGLSTTQYAMEYMISSSNNKLTDTSLDNLLQMCINAPSNMPGRNLARVGLNSAYYSSAKIQSLPHYSDFVAANWSIGY